MFLQAKTLAFNFDIAKRYAEHTVFIVRYDEQGVAVSRKKIINFENINKSNIFVKKTQNRY